MVLLAAATLLAAGLVIGMVGLILRSIGSNNNLISTGAQMIRSIEQLPYASIGSRTHVYFIADEQGAVKIGMSSDPMGRLATLQTGQAEPLSLVHTVRFRTIAAARSAESGLHHLFNDYQMSGEWFDLSDRQLRKAYRIARRLR